MSEKIIPYSEKKLAAADGDPLSIEQIVAAQNLDCAGDDPAAIAEAIGCRFEQVLELLGAAPYTPPRQAAANVGFSQLKGRSGR